MYLYEIMDILIIVQSMTMSQNWKIHFIRETNKKNPLQTFLYYMLAWLEANILILLHICILYDFVSYLLNGTFQNIKLFCYCCDWNSSSFVNH